MADHDGDLALGSHGDTGTDRRRRGLRRPGKPKAAPPAQPANPSGPEPGLAKVLWADIRGRRIPRQPTGEELAWEAEQEAEELAARGGVTGLSPDAMERMRQRSMPR